MKHAHRKVRTGCATCRQRRVKCDELKPHCLRCRRLAASRGQPIHCSYEAVEISQIAGPPQQNGRSQEETSTPTVDLLSSTHLSLVSQYGWPNPTTHQEMQLLYHLCLMRKQLEPAERRGLLAGVIQFSKSLSMAGQFDHLRYSLCSLGASHLKSLTQSSSMAEAESLFRVLALKGMGIELERIRSEGNTDRAATQGLTKSALVMSWYSPEAREYVQLLSGIHALLPDENRPHYRPSPLMVGHTHPATIQPNSPCILTDAAGGLLGHMMGSVNILSKCKLDVDLRGAVRDLYNFLHNILYEELHCWSLDKKLFAMYPIRNWLGLAPRAPKHLDADSGFLMYLFLANFETTVVVMTSLWPAIEPSVESMERVACVARMRKFFQSAVQKRFQNMEQGDGTINNAQVYKACLAWLEVSELGQESYLETRKWYEAETTSVPSIVAA